MARAVTPDRQPLLRRVRRHADLFISRGTDNYGARTTPLWMAQLDPATGRYPEDDGRAADWAQRAYRFIHAPRGCTFYWDQPNVHALYALTALSGDRKYRDAAEKAGRWILNRAVGASGLLLWGNHYFYDAFADEHVQFGQQLTPYRGSEHPRLHEMRPLVPAWEHLYPLAPEVVERAIRAAGEWHLFDAERGGFNRHADKHEGCAFLEAGAVLVDALAFLYARTGDEALLARARAIASFSFAHRHPESGLLVNNPTVSRWDGYLSTSEAGHWARTLQHAAWRLEARAADESIPLGEASQAAAMLRRMGREALAAYLQYGWAPDEGRYYGRLRLDGSPHLEPQSTPYQPGRWSDVWTAVFPSHDYPLQTAMACLELVDEGQPFTTAARRWADICVAEARAGGEGQVRLAEQYGRIIAYLAAYGRKTHTVSCVEAAEALASEALSLLGAQTLFIGRKGGDRYETVDGVGYLLLGLLYLLSDDAQLLRLF